MLCEVTNRPTETKHAKKGDNDEAKFGTSSYTVGQGGREGGRYVGAILLFHVNIVTFT